MKQNLWLRAVDLFHAALERSPEARQAFLEQACDADAELGRLVELLFSKDTAPDIHRGSDPIQFAGSGSDVLRTTQIATALSSGVRANNTTKASSPSSLGCEGSS